MLAGPGRAWGEHRLHRRWDGEGDGVARGQEVVEGLAARASYDDASFPAASGRLAHTAVRLVRGPAASMGAWNISAHGPAPTSPTRSVMGRG